MPDIVVTTDFTEVTNLNNAVKSTKSIFIQTVDSLVREETRAKRVMKKLADTTQANLDLIEKADAIVAIKVQQASDKREKARTREATRAEKEAQRIVAANKKIAEAKAKLEFDTLKNKVETGFSLGKQRADEEARALEELNRVKQATTQETERLRLKYDQIYASSQLYEKSLAELDRAHTLGVLSEKKHKASIEALNLEYQQFSNAPKGAILANNRFSENLNQTGRGLNKFGMYAQQVGYQVGDFFVQVQGGTNILVAFGQQATQLAGLFPGVLGAALGIGISLATALGAAFMRTGKESEESINRTTSAVDTLIKRTQEAETKIRELKTGVPEEEQSVLDQINSLEGQRIVLIQKMLDKSYELQKIEEETGEDYSYILEGHQEKISLLNDEIFKLKEVLRLDKESAKELQDIEKTAKDQAKAQEDMNKKAAYGKNLFHALAGETQSVSIYLSDALRSALGLASVNFSNVKTVADYLAIAQGQMGRGLPSTGEPTMTIGPNFETRGRQAAVPIPKVSATLEDFFGVTETAGGTAGGGGGGGEPRDVIGEFQKQLDLERELVGTSEAYQKVRQALGDDFKTTNPVVIAGLIEQANQIERLTELENKRKEIMDTVKSSMEDAFMSMVDGTKSAKEAFKSMAAEIIKELYRVLVVQQLVNSVSGVFMPSGGGSVRPPPRPPGLATGGSMMANRAYMVGENGPELVIPRHSGSVVNANQTANAMGGSGNFTQNLSINVTGSDATMVRTEVAKMIPQITNATKAAVIDARLRGGQMKQAFR